jgi:hypothetical protein
MKGLSIWIDVVGVGVPDRPQFQTGDETTAWLKVDADLIDRDLVRDLRRLPSTLWPPFLICSL